MDGSSAGKKPSAKKTEPAQSPQPGVKKPDAQESDPDNDDPFAIAQRPAGQKVLLCAPKPMKGRLHRVVCPMCDTQGFIPKAAIGRQVRCANKKCMVPVFEAPATDEKQAPKAPARVSDKEPPAPKKVAKSPSDKKPFVLYGVVGLVLLAGTLGLVSYLNKSGIDNLPAVNIPMPEFDEDKPEIVVTPDVVEPAATDYRAQAMELVQKMIEQSRVTDGNRDKPFCRRLTGDAFLRLGLEDKATAEFRQMDTISNNTGRNNSYYRIAPLMTSYWQRLLAGDDAAAGKRLNEAKLLATKIPKSGLLAIESSVTLAAALAESGAIDEAMLLIKGQQPDATVALRLDAVRHGVWSATSGVLRDSGQTSMSPGKVFAWNEPLLTGVALQLAVRGRWSSAIAWANAVSDPLTTSDTLAMIADQMVAAKAASDVRLSVVAAAEAKGPAAALRTIAVLAKSKDAALWEQAKSLAAAMPVEEQKIPNDVESIIKAAAPNLAAMQLSAEALTDFVVAAVSNADTAAATTGIQRIYAVLVSQLAPTAGLRKACRELENNEDNVKARMAKELGLQENSQEIRARFLAYRRGIDRQANVAEQRRMVLLQLLARVIREGGLSVVQTALADDAMLKQEVCVDKLQGLLFVAAASTGQAFDEMKAVDASLNVAVARIDSLPETEIVQSLVAAWLVYLTDSNSSGAAKLESVPGLAGVRATNAAFMTELAAMKSASAAKQMASVALLNDVQWREVCLELSARILTNRGMMADIQPTFGEAAANPTQRVMALYGMVRGAIDQIAAK